MPVATVAIYYQPLDLGQQTFGPFFVCLSHIIRQKKKKKRKKRGEFRPQLWKWFFFVEVAISPGLEFSRQRITFSHSVFPISLSDALSLPRNISPPHWATLCVDPRRHCHRPRRRVQRE